MKKSIIILIAFMIVLLIINIMLSNKAVNDCINNGQSKSICSELYK